MLKQFFSKNKKGQNKDKAGQSQPAEKAGFTKSRLFGWLWKIGLLVLVIFGSLAALSFWASLSVRVQLNQEQLASSERIEVNFSQSAVDLENNVIPGQLLQGAAEKWQIFETTGRAVEEAKARGFLTVYNKHTPPKALTFVANTRFLSAQESKIFRAVEKIYLPPAKQEGGKLTPSQVRVEVIADSPGEDYNVPPSQFSVPGLSGTAYYYNVWAESFESMSGGFEKAVSQISQEDITKAKDALREELILSAQESAVENLTENILVDPGAILEEAVELDCFEKPGELKEQFNCQGTGQFKWLAFQKSDLEKLAMHLLAAQTSANQEINQQTLAVSFHVKTVLSESQKIILEAQITANTFQPLREDSFKAVLAGKTEQEIKGIVFEDYSQIANLELDFWPFWIKKAPSNLEKIKLTIEF